jgi:uncharacterized RDD family membrane protein YckC
MQWYYAVRRKQVGPLSEAEFQELVSKGKIKNHTLVWNPSMSDWQAYGAIGASGSKRPSRTEATPDSEQSTTCSECGKAFSQEDMISYESAWICPDCKPIFVQKLREGVSLAGAMQYAGFWLRFLAKLIDGLILWAFNTAIYIPFVLLSAPVSEGSTGAVALFLALQMVVMFLQIAVAAAYTTWFLGRYGATPGKMACKIRVVIADGGKIGYGRALGRHFGEFLSAMIFLIGYIMAAFDDQKRSLHDRICNTRVIRK